MHFCEHQFLGVTQKSIRIELKILNLIFSSNDYVKLSVEKGAKFVLNFKADTSREL